MQQENLEDVESSVVEVFPDTTFADYSEFQRIIDTRGYAWFVWPDEGSLEGDVFSFYDNVTTTVIRPIAVESATAMALVGYHDLLPPPNQQIMRGMISECRESFTRVLAVVMASVLQKIDPSFDRTHILLEHENLFPVQPRK